MQARDRLICVHTNDLDFSFVAEQNIYNVDGSTITNMTLILIESSYGSTFVTKQMCMVSLIQM